jgi:hypothetical protein
MSASLTKAHRILEAAESAKSNSLEDLAQLQAAHEAASADSSLTAAARLTTMHLLASQIIPAHQTAAAATSEYMRALAAVGTAEHCAAEADITAGQHTLRLLNAFFKALL